MTTLHLDHRHEVKLSDMFLAYRFGDGKLSPPSVNVHIEVRDTGIFAIDVNRENHAVVAELAEHLAQAASLVRAEIERRAKEQEARTDAA